MKQSLYTGLFTGLVAVIACTVVQWPRQRIAPAPLLASFDGGASWTITSPPVEAPSPAETWRSGNRGVIIPTTHPARHASQLQRILPNVQFERTKLVDAIEFLQQHTDANLRVHWRPLEASGIEQSQPVSLRLRNVTVEQALREVLEEASGSGIGYRIEGNIVIITDAEHVNAQRVMRVYDIRDLMVAATRFDKPQPPRAGRRNTGGGAFLSPPPSVSPIESDIASPLADMVKETIDIDSWIDNGGRIGSIHYFAGHLMIVQTDENHIRISRLFNALRYSLHNPPTTQPNIPLAP